MRASFDTNVPIYALLDQQDSRRTAIAQNLLRELSASGNCFISTQVLNEFANVAIRKVKPALDQQVVLDLLAGLTTFDLVVVTDELIRKAVQRHFGSTISFYDALIVEAAIAGGAEVLYTEDLQHGMRYGQLEIANPFV